MSGKTRTVFIDGFNLVTLPDGTKGTLIVTSDEGLEVQDCPAASIVTWQGLEYMRALDKNGNCVKDEELLTYQRHF